MTLSKVTPDAQTFTFEASTKFEIKLSDLTDLLITAGQGCYFWGRVFVNIDPRKPFKKQDLKLEKEGGIVINTNNLNLESNIYVEDCGDDSDIEIIDNKKVIDFLNTFKTILENPNIKGEFRTNLVNALITQDYGMLDAEDMDYILQTCIFGSCVYG
tara:strand:- start:77 stop:547 length:471 start_codon:yes stop_codon:yes gene_type:complete